MLIISGDPTVAGNLTIGVMGTITWKCECEDSLRPCDGGLPDLATTGKFSWVTCLERGPCNEGTDCTARGGPRSFRVDVTVFYDPHDPIGYGLFLLQLANELENILKANAPRQCGLGEIPNTLNAAMKRARLLGGKPRWIQDTALRKYLQD